MYPDTVVLWKTRASPSFVYCIYVDAAVLLVALLAMNKCEPLLGTPSIIG